MDRATLLAELADRILRVRAPHPTRVAVDGVDAAGKTTLADELRAAIEAAGRPSIRASVDDFHRPAAARYSRGRLSAEAYYHDSFDYATLRTVLLDPLGPAGARRYRRRVFDHRRDRPAEAPLETAARDSVLLFDGIFLQRPELDGCWELVIFLDVPFDVTVKRAMRRDEAEPDGEPGVAELHRRRYVPGQQLYLRSCAPRERAAVVVDNTDPACPAIVDR